MRRESFIYFFLALVTAVLYLPVAWNGFVNYDDPAYVVENPRVQAGLTEAGIVWAFTTGDCSNWHPLTWISHMLDCQLYGTTPTGHHVTNLIFHIANTLLLYGVLRRMTKAFWRSALVAALFAWHPMHVESVAWIAERKDVLSAFFWLLTVWGYFRYVKKPTAGSYLLCLGFFVLGLLSKPMVVTLPFVLLLLDIWPLNRMSHPKLTTNIDGCVPFRKLLLEKVPFLLLTACSCFITFAVQSKGGAVASLNVTPLVLRLANLPIAYVSYVMKLLWPINLCVLYPLQDSIPALQVTGAIVALFCLTAIALFQARKNIVRVPRIDGQRIG